MLQTRSFNVANLRSIVQMAGRHKADAVLVVPEGGGVTHPLSPEEKAVLQKHKVAVKATRWSWPPLGRTQGTALPHWLALQVGYDRISGALLGEWDSPSWGSTAQSAATPRDGRAPSPREPEGGLCTTPIVRLRLHS